MRQRRENVPRECLYATVTAEDASICPAGVTAASWASFWGEIPDAQRAGTHSTRRLLRPQINNLRDLCNFQVCAGVLRTENKLQLTADQPPPSSSTIMNSIWPREGQSVIGEKEKVGEKKKKVVHKTKKSHPSPPTTPHAPLLRGICPRFPAGWKRIGVNGAELEEREGGKGKSSM